jgi:hypothetical protein
LENRATPSRVRAKAASPDAREPAFELPPREAWLTGDVLMDLAARAGIHLLADDYTVSWSTLVHPETPETQPAEGAQPLSVWLDKIQDGFGFAVAQDGPFLRLRNRRWWYDRGREIPRRLVRRWVQLSGGTPGERLETAVEVARWAPLCAGSRPLIRLHLGRLAESPEMKELSTRFEDPEKDEAAPGFTKVVASSQIELRIYALLTPRQQQAIREQGLTLSWRELPLAARALFARSVGTIWEPGIPVERALALHPESAPRLGVRHLPMAVIVDRGGRITWAKQGYTPGDEAEWRTRLARAGG